MAKLYCVPLGHSPRSLFYEQLQNVGYDKGVLVLPSRNLMQQAQREANIRTIDIDFLATTILNDNGYMGLKPLNRRSQELIIKDLVKHLAIRDKLEYFAILAEKKGFIKSLTSLVSQLSRNGVTEAQIKEAFANWGRKDNLGLKDDEINQLYGFYRQYLRNNNWVDLEGKYRLAIRVLQEEKVNLRWQEVCISDFFTFDALQLEFIKVLSRRANVNIGMVYEDDKDKEKVFAAVKKTYEALLGFCELEKVTLPAKQAPENVRVCKLPNRDFEMEWVLTEIKRLLKKGVAAKDILVTFRKFDNYSGLRKLADAYGIPVSIPQSSSLNVQPLSELVLLLLEAQPDTRKGAEAYFKILGSSIGKLLFKVDGEVAEAWREEKYFTSRSQVQAKAREAFAEEATALDLVDNTLEKLLASDTVANFTAVLEEFLNALNLERLLGEMHRAGAIDFQGLKACLHSKQLLLKTLQSLTEDYKNCKADQEKLSVQDFALVLSEAMADYQINLVEGRTDGVLVTEVINAQGLPHKYVFLMGMREGEFPTGNNENWIYNDAERGQLQPLGIDMPTTALAYMEDAYFFATTIALAEDSLVLTYYVDDKAGVSSYVGEVLANYNINEEIISGKQAASLGEAFAWGKQLDNAWVENNLPKHAIVATKVDDARKQAVIYNGVLENEEVQANVKNVVGNMFSPSSLEIYAQCPFRFLGERIWKQSEFREKEEFAAPTDVGNLLHNCLANFLGKHLHEKLPKYDLALLWEELYEDFRKLRDEYIANGSLQQNELWAAEEARLLKMLNKWLRNEYTLQKQWDFVPCAVEWDFNSKNGKPLRMKLADGKSFAIVGRLDRIDKNGDKVFVTDYKLSSVPAASDLPNGIDLQLPIYLLAAKELYGKEVAGGGYLSLKDAKRKSSVKLDDSQEYPFINGRSKDYFAEADDKWQAFANLSEKFLQDYVQGIYDGNFNIQLVKKCNPYCALKNICRVNLLEQGGEDDE